MAPRHQLSEKARNTQQPSPFSVNQKRNINSQQLAIAQQTIAEPHNAPAEAIQLLRESQGDAFVQRLTEQSTQSANTGDLSSFLAQISFNRAKLTIQPKLTVSPAQDQYEQEADSVAQQVVQQINSPVPTSPSVQRQTEDDKDKVQMMRIQRQSGDVMSGVDVSSDVESRIQTSKGSGSPIAENMRGKLEGAFSADFSRVRIHTDSESDRLNRAVQARAFTTGQDIYFRQGEYNPSSSGGQKLLAHELTHVVQQAPQASAITQNAARLNRKRNNILQRQVHTLGGMFSTERYEAYYQENVGDENVTAVGADIKLNFMPNEMIKAGMADQIALTQTVKSLKSPQIGHEANQPFSPPDNPIKEQFKLGHGEADPGRGIDQVDRFEDGETNTSPLYGVMNKNNTALNLTASAPQAGMARFWSKYHANDWAYLYDKPRTKLDFPEQEIGMSFEAIALVIAGQLKDAYLGSIRWGWHKAAGLAARPQLVPPAISLVSIGTPTPEFMAATRKWNTWNQGKRRNRADTGNLDVVKLPITSVPASPTPVTSMTDQNLLARLLYLIGNPLTNDTTQDVDDKQFELEQEAVVREIVHRRKTLDQHPNLADDLAVAYLKQTNSAPPLQKVKQTMFPIFMKEVSQGEATEKFLAIK